MTDEHSIINKQSMEHWLQKAVGCCYTDAVFKQMEEFVNTSFGYHAVVIGESKLVECISNSPIKHRILINHCVNNQADIYSFCCARQDKLPIESDSVDMVYLAHCLEIYKNPQEILSETYRILRPEGLLLISGFNPLSIWGSYCIFGSFFNIIPWIYRLHDPNKITQWLTYLGFGDIKRKLFFWPFLQKIINFAKINLPFSGAYLLVTHKKTIPLTPIMPKITSCEINNDRLLNPAETIRQTLGKNYDS